MAETVKITKKMVLEAIRLVAENGSADFGDVVTADDVIAYVDTTISQLDSKAVKAKERAATKKAEGDALKDVIQSLLNDEFQTIADIINQIPDEFEATQGKVSARLTKLCNEGVAHKDKVKTEDGRTINGYAAGPAPDAE